ncbi:MAG: DUF4019 domain-containing protein [Pseudomonadota bacterium]
MKTLSGTMAVVALILAVGCGGSQLEKQAVDKATTAALEWLNLIDAAKYEESWDKAASLFKIAVTKKQWVGTLTAVRKPMGESVSRTPAQAEYLTSLPGAPDGEYVVLQFKSAFRNKQQAVETVAAMLDKDGRWKVSGYYIK